MATDLDILRHKEWLGLLQPVGLIVSPPALIKAQAVIDRGSLVDLQERLLGVVSTEAISRHKDDAIAWIPNFPVFAQTVLGWQKKDLVGAPGQATLPDELLVTLPSYGETLTPNYAVRDPDSDRWILLIQEIAPGLPFDEDDLEAQGWKASIQAKFERLLRETGVFAGLLVNGTEIRLVYAPSGESSGYLTFPVQAMVEVPGRLILGAMDLLLGEDRLFNVPENQRLTKLLEESRSYQAEVSTKLSGQVLDALWELLRGFQSADAARNGKLISTIAQRDPQHIYGGLIATLMRLVFLLYAEDEGLMPDDEVYQRHYAVSGLYEKLREDASNYPDTIDQRYGAWAALLSLFRLVYDGGGATPEYLPARRGQLFDPDEYPYLEGRPLGSNFETFGTLEAPRISDGVVYRMLDKLLLLDGERLSYRALDVEQIGSVYEAIMGYEVQIANGRSIAVRPKDIVVNVDEILATKPPDRAKLLKDAECELKGNALKEAQTAEAVVAAIGRKVSHRTPNMMALGNLFLQPGEERRRSGSHYTPRKLTQPIVEKTLEPVLKQLGEHPTPEQILELKVCDLAMGSAAFLVEACRQLADKLVEAWNEHGKPEDMPDSVEDVVIARRLVAQRCLYGVDKNPFAVNLARLSLWLVTLAKDLPFTFLDHALKCGDSLVGLTRQEIISFGANAAYAPTFFEEHKQLIKQSATKALTYRHEIQTSDTRSDKDSEQKQALLEDVDLTLEPARLTAKVAIAAFFAGANAKQRQQKREEFGGILIGYEKGLVSEAEIQVIASQLAAENKTVLPFNWELEFPEVFDRENPGFDAIVGNPPFLGGSKFSELHGQPYLAFLLEIFSESRGKSDLVAFFLRRAFDILRESGCIGLVTTKTIAQSDTRFTGLRWIRKNGGTIYSVAKRLRWSGQASVIVSVIHIHLSNTMVTKATIDNIAMPVISAYLSPINIDENPTPLIFNKAWVFSGSNINGKGFVLSSEEYEKYITADLANAEKIKPYIGGDELNSSPQCLHSRFVIDFGDGDFGVLEQYPILLEHLSQTVRLQRQKSGEARLRKFWWHHSRPARELYSRCNQMVQLLASSRHSPYLCFAFQPSNRIFSDALTLFAFDSYSGFAILQSKIHEVWALFFGSSLGDTFRYIPEDCFETFPFPSEWETNTTLEATGKTYYEFRADLMVHHNEGLTGTYNRFHDPDEINPDILKLRDLHAQMDRAVLDAYGWQDIPIDCEFLLDYEDEEFESSSKRKKPWHYRWPEAVHDEVLARLLLLNQERAGEETLGGNQKRRNEDAKVSAAGNQSAIAFRPQKQLDLIAPDKEQLDIWST